MDLYSDYFDFFLAAVMFVLGVVVVPSLVYRRSKRDSDFFVRSWEKSWMMEPFPYHVVGFVGWISIFTGITLCLVWACYFHHRSLSSFSSGCNVPNPVPSISYAIGSNFPERTFFWIAIVIMSHQRILDCNIYYNWFQKYIPGYFETRYYYWWNSMLYVFGVIENIALFSISFFSAVDHPFWHEKVFHVWAVFQQLKMAVKIHLLYNANHPKGPQGKSISLWYHTTSRMINLLCIIMGFVLIQVDIHYCNAGTPIPYLYSFCSCLEYTIVMSNIIFNLGAAFDWPCIMYFLISSEEYCQFPPHKDLGEVHYYDYNGNEKLTLHDKNMVTNLDAYVNQESKKNR